MDRAANCGSYDPAIIEVTPEGRVTLTVGGHVACSVATGDQAAAVVAAHALSQGIGGAFRVIRRGFA